MSAKLPPGLETAPLVSDWVRPDGDGFAVRTGRAELGQGVQAAMLRIAAWELGLPVERLTITGPDTGASPNEGVTAGSLSMTQGGAALRAATSAARVLCLAEAGRQLNTEAGRLAVIDGAVLEAGVDTGLTLPVLATRVDLDVPVVDHAAPLGQPLDADDTSRHDLRARLTGAPFVHDLSPEGLLHGRVFAPPSMAARLPDALDLAPLEARPGVVAAVRDGNFLGLVAETSAAADSAAAWFEARLEWEGLPIVPSDPHSLLEASTAEMEQLEVPEAGLPSSEPVIDITCRRPFLSHAPMGPSAAMAQWGDDGLTVWSHSQGVYPLRDAMARVLDLPQDAIRVIHTPGPGCYGHNGADDVALDAALLARAVPGHPVRLVWSRATEFRTAPLGAAMATRVRLWMEDGHLSAARVSVTSPPHSTRPGTAGHVYLRAGAMIEGGTPFPPAPDLPANRGNGAARNARPIYAAPALVERKLVDDLPWRTSALRALGGQLNVFAIETGVEAALMAEGLDPFDGRLASLEDTRARTVLEKLREIGADIIGTEEPDRSWGIGLARYKNVAAWAGVLAEIELGDDIRVTRVRAAVDTGEVIHPDGARNQIEGGIIQALSWTLKEAVPLDGARVAAESWEDYPILRFSEVPQIETALIHRPEDPPYGCAEAVAGPASAAVGNAVQRMIGVPIRDLPITRERIIAAVSEA
ncbi:xanthine dehydrogenase family protein molybdopterin-binding subunit [Ponticoccus sp. SC2-23]|uniref:molybdopterin cofactor-binding domain-containing protein n=1 Tax=Alexandriicola marinus TaxID=2081710 RepID=UPI000FD6BA6E|nr:molybdopterin cofactor-binding domain-containing protein [Alexandriicola marinus]MBM1220773.1 xanthine dehydrogenase family protein molybdopterin-binding subunit [Ponticoccus sp. SC6-9]MBM1225343.1 xanthine dehydrogenase family protein molybdopterin-binding subunit [Ponticoccus sp. SC6-15]MBM1227526.1 xanthine dehydrogenase family protein molybdopterin-binding subunit [Ponticoccus sp. SC6-38]MBM1234836.1 xanthine dehydrogenase family protein molybdopterin-binding subunit [Ponticoccus sp. SC6